MLTHNERSPSKRGTAEHLSWFHVFQLSLLAHCNSSIVPGHCVQRRGTLRAFRIHMTVKAGGFPAPITRLPTGGTISVRDWLRSVLRSILTGELAILSSGLKDLTLDAHRSPTNNQVARSLGCSVGPPRTPSNAPRASMRSGAASWHRDLSRTRVPPLRCSTTDAIAGRVARRLWEAGSSTAKALRRWKK